MSDEIVRRLRSRSASSLSALKESMPVHGINEEDEDIEKKKKELIDDEEELDTPTSEENEDIPEEDTEEEVPSEDEVDIKEPEEEVEVRPYIGNANPLDNAYAVNYKLGQEVALAYANGTKSPFSGFIEGYDKEGFYRIKWNNGLTTNGITDIALVDMVENTSENKCVCGSTDYVNENNQLVCDKCGRIREGLDTLTIADKSRSKGKKMIRSEAHPISTANIPNIAESIRKAMKGKKIQENDTSDEIFSKLLRLEGEFWTRLEELVADIEELGYTVDDYNSEYVVVSAEDDEGKDYGKLIPIGGTARTMTLDLNRSRMV